MLLFITSILEAKLSCTPFNRDLLLSNPDEISACSSSNLIKDLLKAAAKIQHILLEYILCVRTFIHLLNNFTLLMNIAQCQ